MIDLKAVTDKAPCDTSRIKHFTTLKLFIAIETT
jgi:hypothetical protein